MPKVEKIFTLHVSAEKFLQACSVSELIEVEMLIGSKRYQNKINSAKNPNNQEFALKPE